MDKAQEQMLTASIQLVGGVISARKFIVTVVTVLLANPIILSEFDIMDAFYYPADSFIWVVLVAIIASVFVCIGWYGEFKRKNAPAEDFKGAYIGSMILNMVATPVVALLIVGWFSQLCCPQINLVTYCLFLVIVEMFVCLGILYLLNYGIKGFIAAFKKTAEEIAESKADAEGAVKIIQDLNKH